MKDREEDEREDWKIGEICFSVDGLDKEMVEPIQLVQDISNGRTEVKNTLERLDHVWNFDDGLYRSWDKKHYRLQYQKVVNVWNSYMEKHGWKWCNMEFYKFFARRCFVWPNATTGKWFSLKNERRVWYTVFFSKSNCNEVGKWEIGYNIRYITYQSEKPSKKYVGKGYMDIMKYINRCKEGAKWRDLSYEYNWDWGKSEDLASCSFIGKACQMKDGGFFEPRWKM